MTAIYTHHSSRLLPALSSPLSHLPSHTYLLTAEDPEDVGDYKEALAQCFLPLRYTINDTSTHPVHTPCQYTLSIHSINPPYQPTSPTLSPHQHPLSTPPHQPTLSPHLTPPPYPPYHLPYPYPYPSPTSPP